MLVTCVAYQDGKKLAEIPVADVSDYISLPNTFVWVALSDPAPEEIDVLQEEFDLHPLAVEDAKNGNQRPKVEEYGDSLFVVLHVIDVANGDLDVGQVAIFVGRNYVVSVRRDTSHGLSEVRRRTEAEPELLSHGPAYVLYALMDSIVDRYFPAIEMLEADIEAIEERIFDGITTRAQVEALYALKRKLSVISHAALPLQEATSKLQAGRIPRVCMGLSEYFRDVYDHLGRLVISIDNLRDMVSTATTVNLSLITIQESEVTKQLAAYAALAAVPTMIAGVYGMNFNHMPELTWRYGYLFALGLMAGIDGYLVYRFRKVGWL